MDPSSPSPSASSADSNHEDLGVSPDSIVFFYRGSELDTSLNVLGQEFHVHSTVLKGKAQWFDTMIRLHSLDRVGNTQGHFKYQWVSEIEKDGSWHLVAANAENMDGPDYALLKIKPKGYRKEQITAFTNVLHAVYGETFELDADEPEQQINDMTQLADYYRALPAMSLAINTFIAQGTLRVLGYESAHLLIHAAYKLHNPLLFRDCICILASFIEIDQYDDTIDPMDSIDSRPIDPNETIEEGLDQDLKDIVRNARQSIVEKISEVERYKRQTLNLPEDYPRFTLACASLDMRENPTQMGYLQALDQIMMHESDTEEFAASSELIDELMVNKLKSQGMVRGLNAFTRNRFLCAEVSDEDLPWKTTQRDW